MEKEFSAGEAERMLLNALEIGARMLISGAEIQRVENSIQRICLAYGAERVEVFSITYVIVATISSENWGTITHSRRVHSFSCNLQELTYLNDLSRKICDYCISMDEIEEELEKMLTLPGYSTIQSMLIYALISASFSLFFGGTFHDALASALVGAGIKIVELPLKSRNLNRFLVVVLSSVAAGIMANCCVFAGLGDSVNKISIGNIMILIPGLMFTNCIREMMSDNFLSGVTRLCETVFLAVSIALGFAIANYFF
jgi:uncharacterized membrane protein YjjP (DUF1212 family)